MKNILIILLINIIHLSTLAQQSDQVLARVYYTYTNKSDPDGTSFSLGLIYNKPKTPTK